MSSTFDSSPADGDHIQGGGEQPGSEMRVIPSHLLYRHDVNLNAPLRVEVDELTLRLTVELLTDVPIDSRQKDWTSERTLAELADMLWPEGWQPDKDIPQLIATIWRVDNLYFPREIDGTSWWQEMFLIPQIPDMSARPDLEFPVTVRYPAVSGWGGIIHLPTLRELGVLSDTAYRAGLGVAQMWGDVAGNRGGRYVQAECLRMARNPAGQLVDDRMARLFLGMTACQSMTGGRPALYFSMRRERPCRRSGPLASATPTLTLTLCLRRTPWL